jgi:hypothetical protein
MGAIEAGVSSNSASEKSKLNSDKELVGVWRESNRFSKWLDGEPDVPDGEWYKRSSGMTVCGAGELIKIFLLPGQAPKGRRVP